MIIKYLTLLYILLSNSIYAEDNCLYENWTSYKHTKLYKHSQYPAYFFKTHYVRIDADGSPNAYHPNDVVLKCINGKKYKGLDCPQNAGYPNSNWWSSVLATNPAPNEDKPFVQTQGKYKGYFVSKTSLVDPEFDEKHTKRYVDASTIPYFVFPKDFYRMKGTGYLGDLGIVINRTNGTQSMFVVADIGPSKAELGEMSIKLAEKLGGNHPNPRTGEGSPVGEFLYIIFPKSSKEFKWPLNTSEIHKYATNLIKKQGGIEAVFSCLK